MQKSSAGNCIFSLILSICPDNGLDLAEDLRFGAVDRVISRVFRHQPDGRADLAETLERANSEGMLTAATVPDRNARDITETDFSAGVIAVIGNEGNGVTEAVKSIARERITIKMKGEAESLNASVAAVITMWEIMR